jgi:exosortase/archaeosortase family protein
MQISGYRLTPALLWKVLACSQAVLSLWMIQTTQELPSLTLLCLVIWGGAIICVEDELEGLSIRGTSSSTVAGLTLLVYATWRSSITIHYDSTVTLLPLFQGLGLALIARPFKQLKLFRDSLLVLSLFPLQLVLTRILPDYELSALTGRLSQLLLLCFGADASVKGRIVDLGGSGVAIQGPCNSIDMIAQLTAIAIVFTLAFPIRNKAKSFAYIAGTPLVALATNASRIAILASITNSSLSHKQQLFKFFHEEWGSFVFVGLATVLIGQIYLTMIEHELGQPHE